MARSGGAPTGETLALEAVVARADRTEHPNHDTVVLVRGAVKATMIAAPRGRGVGKAGHTLVLERGKKGGRGAATTTSVYLGMDKAEINGVVKAEFGMFDPTGDVKAELARASKMPPVPAKPVRPRRAPEPTPEAPAKPKPVEAEKKPKDVGNILPGRKYDKRGYLMHEDPDYHVQGAVGRPNARRKYTELGGSIPKADLQESHRWGERRSAAEIVGRRLPDSTVVGCTPLTVTVRLDGMDYEGRPPYEERRRLKQVSRELGAVLYEREYDNKGIRRMVVYLRTMNVSRHTSRWFDASAAARKRGKPAPGLTRAFAAQEIKRSRRAAQARKRRTGREAK